jgi:hypothetical protein
MKAVFSVAVTVVILAGMVSPATAGKDTGDYLTADGQLKEVLELRDVQGGFAGFTGSLWKVEKNGQWKKYQVFNQKLTEKEDGKLTKDQLQALAKELAKFDMLTLKNTSFKGANPHKVTITFGEYSRTLAMTGGQPLPKADVNSEEGRFAGVVQEILSVLKAKKAEEK